MSSRQLQTIPWTFFQTNGVGLTNLSQNDDVIVSDPIPPGFRGFVRDINVIFTTSGNEVLAFEKISKGGGRTRFADTITANTNGSFDLVLGAGDKVAIVITTTGVGVLDIVWDGEIQEVGFPRIAPPQRPLLIDEIGIGEGGGL